MQGDITSILMNLLGLAALGMIIYYGLWFYETLVEDEKNGKGNVLKNNETL